MTFSKEQQQHARKIFIDKCRQKVWEAACNADYVSKHFDQLMADYAKLRKEDTDHEAQIKALDSAIDYHTKDNGDKRKSLQERRNVLTKQMQFLQQSAAEAQQAMQQLYAHAEQNLALAKHGRRGVETGCNRAVFTYTLTMYIVWRGK